MANRRDYGKYNLRPVRYPSGDIKHFIDTKTGKQISNRQGKARMGQPLPGSKGYASYNKTRPTRPQPPYKRLGLKKEGSHFVTPTGEKLTQYQVNKLSHANVTKWLKMQTFIRNNPGATPADIDNPNWKDVPNSWRRTAEEFNRVVDSQRKRRINAMEKYGLINHDEAVKLQGLRKQEQKELAELLRMTDWIQDNPTKYKYVVKEFNRMKAKHKKTVALIEKLGLAPNEGDYKEGYYHP